MSHESFEMVKVPRPLFERLRDIAVYAASLDKVELRADSRQEIHYELTKCCTKLVKQTLTEDCHDSQ